MKSEIEAVATGEVDRNSYKYWQYTTEWRVVPSPSYGGGIKRAVDLSHGLHDYPGPEPHIPPPAYAHVEPFGNGIQDRARAFDHVRVEPFRYSDSDDSVAAMITVCTQMDPQLEGPFLGYLPQHVYGELDPKLKMIAKDPANVSLAQLITKAAIIRRPAGPKEMVSLEDIQELSQHVQPGDAVLLNTGYLDASGIVHWPVLGPASRRQGRLLHLRDRQHSVEGRGGGHQHPESQGFQNGHQPRGHRVSRRCRWTAHPRGVAAETYTGSMPGPADASRSMRARTQGRRPVADRPAVAGRCAPPPYPRSTFADKNRVTRRLRVDPFHVDNCLEDLGMFVTFNSHLGAHVEVPFGNGKPDISHFPIENLVGVATIFDVPAGPGQQITAAMLEKAGPDCRAGDIALLRTGYSDWNWGRDDFYDRSPSIAIDAVDWLIGRKVKAVASDCASLDAQSPLSGEIPDRRHTKALLDAGIPVASNLTNIAQIFVERPWVVLAPLRIEGTYVAPVRAVAVEWE
jgi:kynurenine formamidase